MFGYGSFWLLKVPDLPILFCIHGKVDRVIDELQVH